MRPQATSSLFHAEQAPRLELLLFCPDGESWAVSFSAGVERFIGLYPQLGGLDPGGPLLQYRPAG